jgi:hypothetical protein
MMMKCAFPKGRGGMAVHGARAMEPPPATQGTPTVPDLGECDAQNHHLADRSAHVKTCKVSL